MRNLLLLTTGLLVAGALGDGAQAYTHKILYSFCAKSNCTDGAGPQSALIADGAGNLYGTTTGGGKVGPDGFQHGVVFELTPNAQHTRWSYRVLHSFCQKDNCSDGDMRGDGLVDARFA